MTSGFIYDAATAAQTIQMVNEWNEQRKDASAWASRNTQEYVSYTHLTLPTNREV